MKDKGTQEEIESLKEELRVSEEKRQRILGNMLEGMVVQCAQGKVIDFNSAALKILGLTENQLLGRDSMDPRWKSIKEDGSPFPGEEHPAMVVLSTGKKVENVIMGVEDPLTGLRWIKINSAPIETAEGINSVTTFQDITEDQFRGAELEAYARGLEAHAIIARTDLRGRITYVNDRFSQISGYSKEELLGQDHRIINSNFHSKDFFEQMWKTIQAGNVWRGEVKNKNKAGGYYWVDTIISPLLDSAGEVKEYIAFRYEITDKKNAEVERAEKEKALEETKEYLNLALEGAGLGIWDWDLRDNGVRFDRRWMQMLGLDFEKELMQLSTWEDRVHPDDLERCYADIKAYMDGKTDRYENIHRMKHADGHWVYILDRGRFSDWDEEGKPIRFTGTHLDITDTKEKESDLDFILKSAEVGIWKFNPIKNELFWNASMYDLFDVNPKDFNGAYEAWLKTLHPDCAESAPKDFENALLGTEDFNATFKIVTGDKKIKHIGARATIERDDSGNAIFVTGINWDRTKEQEATNELNRQMKIAQHHAKLASIGELAAGVGHEINNPLAIVKGYVETIQRKLKKEMSTDVLADYLDKIHVASERIAKIVQGLRTFSRSDTGDIADFNPLEAVKESCDMLREIYEKEGIKFLFKIDNKNVFTFGNRGKFQQVLMNLLSNAKDAVSSNTVKEIKVYSELKSDLLEIKVSDNGSGIAKDIVDKIFDPFFTTKEVNQGTGIGLSLAYNMIKEMDGDLNVETDLEKGSCFIISLPVQLSSKTIAKTEEESNESTQLDAKILVAEDEPEIRMLLEDILEDFGAKVQLAEDGEKAYELFMSKPNSWDLIISDMKMPRIDGPSLLKKIRYDKKLSTQPKFIFITGGVNVNFEGEEDELNELIDGYILKPFKESEILNTLAKILKV